jgi:hypothetical protein
MSYVWSEWDLTSEAWGALRISSNNDTQGVEVNGGAGWSAWWNILAEMHPTRVLSVAQVCTVLYVRHAEFLINLTRHIAAYPSLLLLQCALFASCALEDIQGQNRHVQTCSCYCNVTSGAVQPILSYRTRAG